MKKSANNTSEKMKKHFSTHVRWLLTLALIFVILSGILYVMSQNRVFLPANLKTYWHKCDLLYSQVVTPEVEARLGASPAGEGHAVFVSISDGKHRAHVYTGTGADLHDAWDQATKAALPLMNRSHYEPNWIRVDVVCESETVSEKKLARLLKSPREAFFRRGLALDEGYHTALLETELNSYGIYDYEEYRIDRGRLERYLTSMDRPVPEKLNYRTFRTLSWFCGEDSRIIPLVEDGYSIGRRPTEPVDADLARQLILSASDYLANQLQEDGSFRYGVYPRFGNDIEGYNILRHAGTLWSLICRYRIAPEEHIAEAIHRSLDFLLTQVVLRDADTAYVLEADSSEFKLGGCALSVIALTEYMEVFEDRQYEDLCRKLGNGILTFQDPQEGSYIHVLNQDFTLKEATRTVYYDGEATFALCRLYDLTRDAQWLEAARKAADYFVREDYTQYCDHWISYALNDLTDYTNEPAYYTFALRNLQENLENLHRETTFQTALELVGTTWKIYERMVNRGVYPEYRDQFRLEDLQEVTQFRVQRLIDNYFFPETAMYMDDPDRVLDAFFVRHQHFRTRIDDVQHAIGGLLLYRENYEDLFAQP